MIESSVQARERSDKTEALVRLAIARRERLDKADLAVYVNGLAFFSSATVRRACERLQAMPESEFGPRFPTLATVIGMCRAIVEEQRIRQALTAPPGERASPERLAKFLEDVRAEIRRHEMP